MKKKVGLCLQPSWLGLSVRRGSAPGEMSGCGSGPVKGEIQPSSCPALTTREMFMSYPFVMPVNLNRAKHLTKILRGVFFNYPSHVLVMSIDRRGKLPFVLEN